MQILHVQSLNFYFRLTTALTLKLGLHWAITEKIQTWGWGLRTWYFPGVSKKEHVKILWNNVELPSALFFRLGISKDSHETL